MSCHSQVPGCFGSVRLLVFSFQIQMSIWRSSHPLVACCPHGVEQKRGSQLGLLPCIQILRGLQKLSDQDKYHSHVIFLKSILIQKPMLNNMSKCLNNTESDLELSWSYLTHLIPVLAGTSLAMPNWAGAFKVYEQIWSIPRILAFLWPKQVSWSRPKWIGQRNIFHLQGKEGEEWVWRGNK